MEQKYSSVVPQDFDPLNATKNDYLDYNYNLYSSTMLLKWVKSELNPATSSLGDPNKKESHLKILTELKRKIKTIQEIDLRLLDRKERLKDHLENLVLVNTAINLLNQDKGVTFETVELSKKLAYTNQVQDFISYWNGHRLDMVWSRNFIEVMLLASAATLPALSRLLAIVALVNGILSYSLYFLRGGLDVTKMVKHTVQEEDFYVQKEISTWERLMVQYKLRYARIINDIVLWGPVNLLTCHYLVGSGLLGNLGNGLTVFLLMGDLYMTTVVKSQSNHNFERLNREMRFKFGMQTAEDVAYFKNLREKPDLSVEETAELALLPEQQNNQSNDEKLDHLFTAFKETQAATNRDFDLVIAYQTALVASFSLIFVACIMTPLNMPLLIAGSVGCFLFQFLINLKDMYLRLEGETNEHNKHAIYQEMFTRIFLQILIPAAIISAGILVMPLMPTLSVWLMFGMCMSLAAIMVTLAEDLMAEYRLEAQAKNLPLPLEKKASPLDIYLSRSQHMSYIEAQAKHNDRQISHLCYSALALSFMAGIVTMSLSSALLPVGISLMAGSALFAAIGFISSSNGFSDDTIGVLEIKKPENGDDDGLIIHVLGDENNMSYSL